MPDNDLFVELGLNNSFFEHRIESNGLQYPLPSAILIFMESSVTKLIAVDLKKISQLNIQQCANCPMFARALGVHHVQGCIMCIMWIATSHSQ